MEPVGAWGPVRVAAWLRGLDAAVQGYPFEAWGLAGPDLLGLSARALEALGVWRLGHQELLLEAVEQLRTLDAGLASTSLRTLTERLRELAQGTQSLVLGGLSVGAAPRPPPLALLARVVDLVGAAKGLFYWLNRYLFSTLNDFSASRDIVLLCAQLAETLQVDCPAAERDSQILRICQHIVGICESIVGCSPPALLDCRAELQRVGLVLPPSPRGSPPMSPDTLTLPPGLWGRPPTSPDTPMLPPSPWRSSLTSPDTPMLPSDPQGTPLPLLTAPLGLEITSTSSCLHFVSATTSEALAAHGGCILPGDEIVQVNEQVVVGWTRANLAKKLLEKASGVTLVLKRIPLDLPSLPPSPRQQLPGAFLDGAGPPSPRSSQCPGSPVSLSSRHDPSPLPEWKGVRGAGGSAGEPDRSHRAGLRPCWGAWRLVEPVPSHCRHVASSPAPRAGRTTGAPSECGAGWRLIAGPPRWSRGFAAQGSLFSPSAAADLDSGPESAPDTITDEEDREDKQDSRLPGAAVGELLGLPGHGAAAAEEAAWEGGTPPGTPCSPGACAAAGPCAAELSPTAAPAAGAQGAEPGQLPREGSPQTGRRPKGVATRVSRRRVSCRDLGRVDCDGWLLKKKDHVAFMAQKWKRCWFVLKGHTLYWYHHPNDEKAAGLINVATYDLESTREQKKKYVFQLSHQRYKPFIFAAETLADLSMWVSHLITAKTKYAQAHQSVPDREEDCYSETEAEDPDDESPRHGCDSQKKRLQNTPEKAQLFPAGGESSSAASSPQGSPRPCSPMDPAGEDLESLMHCLKQGGLSLMGQQRFLTEEQCRKSFIRRNKNPHINEKVHAVRALQSTLKAKLVELQALEQLLGDAVLTSEKFTRWKEEHQELYQELQEWQARQQGQDGNGRLGAEHSPPEEAAEP